MSDIFGKISIQPDKPESARRKTRNKPAKQLHRKQKPPKTFKSSTLTWLFIPIGFLLVYTIVGFWGVPYYITQVIPEQVSENYDLNLHPGKVSFNPYTFTLNLESTSLTDPGGDPIISIPNFELDFAPIQLMRMDLVCNSVSIISPSVNIVRLSDGSYNFSTLIPQLSEQIDGSGITGFSDLPFFFSLNNISITDGIIVFDDKPTKKTHNIHELQLQLPTLSNIAFKANEYIDPQFSAIVNGSMVTFKKNDRGSTSHSPSTRQLSWDLKDIKVQDYANYLPFDFPFSINKGTADGTLDLTFNNVDHLEDRLTVNFDLAIADIDIETQKTKLEVSSPLVKLSGSFVPVKKIFTVNTLTLDSPTFTAHSNDLLQDISDIFLPEKTTVDQPIPVTKPVSFALHSFQFKKGRLKQIRGVDKNESSQEWMGLNLTMSNYVSDESYKLADIESSVLNISGHLENGSNDFSYTAIFESPSTVSGELFIDKMTSNTLLSLILPDEKSLKSTGTGTLNARLTISQNNKTQQFVSSFSNVGATINNVEFFEKAQPVFSADKLSLRGAEPNSPTANLGKISVKNGILSFTRQEQFPLFSKIDSKLYVATALDYQGKIIINSPKAKSLPFTLTDATIQYSNIESEKSENNVVLSGNTDNKGKVSAKGKVLLNPFKIEVSTTFTNLNSGETTALLPRNSFITKTAGKLSGKGTFTFPQTSFTGHIVVSNGQFAGNGDQTISWDKFELENINYSAHPYHVGIGDININKPQITTSINDENDSIANHFINLLRLKLRNSKQASPNNKKISISPIDIQTISVTGGQVTVKDNRLTPPWTGQITELSGVLKNIHSASSADNSNFEFTGRLDNSDFSWTGSIDPFKDTNTDKYSFELTSYPLTVFSSQLEPLSEVNIKSASINLNYTSYWKDGDQHQSLHSTISQLRPLSLHSESALPLALLTNKAGVLNLPPSTLTTSLSGYSNYFETLINSFNKLIIKGNLSPLLLTKGDFSDLIDNEYIDFKPGQFMLSEKGRENLARYGALLVAHPNIKLSLSRSIFSQIDREQLYNQLEKNESVRVKKENEKLFKKWQQKKKEYESQVTRNQNIAQEEGSISESDIPVKVLAGFRPLLPEPVTVDDEMLYELAEKRLEIVRQHIITRLSVAPERVEIKQESGNELSQDSISKGVQIEIEPLF